MNQPSTYIKAFEPTVNLYKSSGRPLKVIAQELGISVSTLSKWVRQYKLHGGDSFPGKGQVRSSEEELKTLRKELTHVRQERDILKKAVAIFSGPQGRGTNS